MFPMAQARRHSRRGTGKAFAKRLRDSAMNAPQFRIIAIDLFERDVVLRVPFRFGVVTLTACPQAFVRTKIALADGRVGTGHGAELLAPKWFDKNLALSNEDNFEQLRVSMRRARDAYLADSGPRSAFAHAAAHYWDQIDECGRRGLNPLVACFGPALMDRALLDALCHALGVSFYTAINGNLPGLDATLTPDLKGFEFNAFLGGLTAAPHVDVRHTVGLVDAITDDDLEVRVDDGLPETLEQVITVYGNRYFKLKLSGNLEADIERLTRIADVLERLPDYTITLDGNEQFADADASAQFWRRVARTPGLRRMAKSTIYIEQPLPRAITLDTPITALAEAKAVLIDEADGTVDAFPAAIARGYTGVSTKSCKGLYKSMLNAGRCAALNRGGKCRYFMSAEDLTTQAGLAVQQDLALVNVLGLTHVERNGHHYVHGFAGQGAGAAEQQAFLRAHPDLYEGDGNNVRLRLRAGRVALGSLAAPGFASGATPDAATLAPLATPLARTISA
jgi:hypothetical protein